MWWGVTIIGLLFLGLFYMMDHDSKQVETLPGAQAAPLGYSRSDDASYQTATTSQPAQPLDTPRQPVPQAGDGPRMGIEIDPLSSSISAQYGLMTQSGEYYGLSVTSVLPQGPAEKAGLRRGDIIKDVDGNKVNNVNLFNGYENTKDIGSSIVVGYLRNGKERKSIVTLR